ncbi:MAG: hypothetical protein J1E98_14650 [Lachnospiraceae bacterium]|nr:hypothetical protein [Lachnospiraceae bacterium]
MIGVSIVVATIDAAVKSDGDNQENKETKTAYDKCFVKTSPCHQPDSNHRCRNGNNEHPSADSPSQYKNRGRNCQKEKEKSEHHEPNEVKGKLYPISGPGILVMWFIHYWYVLPNENNF